MIVNVVITIVVNVIITDLFSKTTNYMLSRNIRYLKFIKIGCGFLSGDDFKRLQVSF